MVQKQIINHHGRIENVKLFNVDPTNFIKEAKLREEERIKAEKEAAKKRQEAIDNGEEIEEAKAQPAAQAVEEEKKDEAPEYVQYENPSMTLFDIFQEYGKETKNEVDEDPTCQKSLYYDFTPYNSKDPVLLSLMTAKKYP